MNSELIINQSEKLFIIEDEDDTIQFKINNNKPNKNKNKEYIKRIYIFQSKNN